MIRVVQKTDITKVADIWLDTNIKAHNFISAQYWESNYELVKEALHLAGREDLIGFDKKCLIRPRKLAADAEDASSRYKKKDKINKKQQKPATKTSGRTGKISQSGNRKKTSVAAKGRRR